MVKYVIYIYIYIYIYMVFLNIYYWILKDILISIHRHVYASKLTKIKSYQVLIMNSADPPHAELGQ